MSYSLATLWHERQRYLPGVLAALAPLQSDYGSQDHFDRMLDIVLAGLRARARPQP